MSRPAVLLVALLALAALVGVGVALGGPPPPPPPDVTPPAVTDPGADTTPPGDVRGLQAIAGNLSVALSWRPPGASDFDHVEIGRAPGRGGEASSLVYEGAATTFVARGLAEGVEYRFEVVAVDEAGNRSAGVAAVVVAAPHPLVTPVNGSTVTPRRVRVVWERVAGAGYYNLQLWHGGKKRLSVWPKTARYVIPRQWRFEGRPAALTPGSWRLYVWPGFGAQAEARYGELHVEAILFVVPA